MRFQTLKTYHLHFIFIIYEDHTLVLLDLTYEDRLDQGHMTLWLLVIMYRNPYEAHQLVILDLIYDDLEGSDQGNMTLHRL